GRVHAEPERLSLASGTNIGRVLTVFEDRERNVWVGTTDSLHRFSRSNVVRDTAPPCIQNDFVEGTMVAGDEGSLWISCDDGTGGHVREIRGGANIGSQDAPIFRVGYRDPEGTVWFGGSAAISRLENGRLVTAIPMPPQLTGRPMQALVREASGAAMWASV